MIRNLFLIFILALVSIACTQTTKPTAEKKVHINKTIEQNKIEAKEAKEAYQRLQRERNKE